MRASKKMLRSETERRTCTEAKVVVLKGDSTQKAFQRVLEAIAFALLLLGNCNARPSAMQFQKSKALMRSLRKAPGLADITSQP